MERLRKAEPAAGRKKKPLTSAQKEKIAEARRVAASRLAEREILFHDSSKRFRDPAEQEKAEAEYQIDRPRINADLARAIQAIRSGRWEAVPAPRGSGTVPPGWLASSSPVRRTDWASRQLEHSSKTATRSCCTRATSAARPLSRIWRRRLSTSPSAISAAQPRRAPSPSRSTVSVG